MSIYIFTGPSFSHLDVQHIKLPCEYKIIENIKSIESNNKETVLYFLPPVSCGDLFKLSKLQNIKKIGIIDGFFENTSAVWHKEILYCLNNDIGIFGASSMGALRASELDSYGMVGVGRIYQDYASGRLENDDEVTVIHAHRKQGYSNISEAMVNIRYNLENALSCDVISKGFFKSYLIMAETTFYKYRNYGFIGERCVRAKTILRNDLEVFFKWLEKNIIDQKKIDALKLIQEISSYQNKNMPFDFQDTHIWRGALAD